MNDRGDSLTELIPALIAAQRVMKPALKLTQGQRGKYVKLEHAWDACKEALWDNGLTVIQTSRIGDAGDARLVTTLMHSSGQWISSEYPLKPAKGDDPQALGAAMTYARRYALLAIVGLAPEDDDGEQASRPGGSGRRDRRHEEDPIEAGGRDRSDINRQFPPKRQQAKPSDPARSTSDGPTVSDGPRLGTASQKTRDRWRAWCDKLLDRWHRAEPIVGEKDFTAREHRIAQALITEAGPEIEAMCRKPAEAGRDPVRDPKKVWDVVHRLVAGNFAWVRWATLEHLKRHVAPSTPAADEPRHVNRADAQAPVSEALEESLAN